MSPSAERLLSKITNLDEMLREFEARSLSPEQERIVETCKRYLMKAGGFLDRPSLGSKFPFFSRKHPHLVWELLHRVDEHCILLMTQEEFGSKAIEVKTAFDLNIKEEKVRNDWIGPKGRLLAVVDDLPKGASTPSDMATVKEALQLVNEQMDRTFWQLSANTLTSVWSAVILGVLMRLAWTNEPGNELANLGKQGPSEHYKTLIILGLMGACVSNLLTKDDFLYVRGGPFFRYWLHNLMAKPLIGAFAAVFIYVLEKSKLLFSISQVPADKSKELASQLITFNVSAENAGYVYAVLAITSAFGADKLLRSTFDSVLKRMERKAEKTEDSADKK
jgi:hypothetical protein